MDKRVAVVIGATGLIGSQLVEKLLKEDSFDIVRVLVRRPFEKHHPKLEVFITDFSNLVDYKNKLGNGTAIFCSIGTTNKKMKGDKVAYRKIDYDIAVNGAQLGKEAGFSQYLLVSSVGADIKAKGFYLKLKGEVESAIAELNYTTFHIFQPSFLLGTRNEVRFGELTMKNIFKAISSLLSGKWEKYRAVEAHDVAIAMIEASKLDKIGNFIYQYPEINELIK